MVLAIIRDLGGWAFQREIVGAADARCNGDGPGRAAIAGTLRRLVNAGTIGATTVLRPIRYHYPPVGAVQLPLDQQ
ncbi:hypothetical protein TSH100_03975 [Azospirillum sp. TSH100]|uniref:hypothetical protein n=1 Tax=Azospirillum sp. TSH100 TaxID=652764 RepID=UPI000D60BB13|nr:hypothetical protein [Azospirillum sp. TSH100]PWC89804.1 hypothetical protein TSH100_03975 [Azospirillum sp. TSH100]QCG92344.1 hypothetical protein E6C72_31560 [Azospirillum sp. TSH100]